MSIIFLTFKIHYLIIIIVSRRECVNNQNSSITTYLTIGLFNTALLLEHLRQLPTAENADITWVVCNMFNYLVVKKLIIFRSIKIIVMIE